MRIAQEPIAYSLQIVNHACDGNHIRSVPGVSCGFHRNRTTKPTAVARRARAFWLLFGVLSCAPPALAQKHNAQISGTIVDKASRAPIAKVELILVGDSRSVLSDSAGRYTFEALPNGLVRFLVRAAGYPATQLVVALTPGEKMTRLIELDSAKLETSAAQRLPGVSIEAPAAVNRRLVDFERRRVTGQGQYLTREEIERNGYNNLQDAMRTMRGVEVHCGGSGCSVRMARAPMQCNPEYVVDERVDPVFGPTIPIRDIDALEVYTGASDVPGEFAGRNAGCGVIVIWTKSGPARKKPTSRGS